MYKIFYSDAGTYKQVSLSNIDELNKFLEPYLKRRYIDMVVKKEVVINSILSANSGVYSFLFGIYPFVICDMTKCTKYSIKNAFHNHKLALLDYTLCTIKRIDNIKSILDV